MATGILSPVAKQYFWDLNGEPLAFGLVYTYLAGTSTPATTYTDVGLLVANSQPIVLNAEGYCVIYLPVGTAFKYVVTQPATPPPVIPANVVWSQDNITASASQNNDIVGVAGESLSPNEVVYLADGSGGTTPGTWAKASSVNAYSSNLPQVAIAPFAIQSGQSGTIRLSGRITGLAGLTPGLDYYIAAVPGTLTPTIPVLARRVGTADSSSSLVMEVPHDPVTITGTFTPTDASGAGLVFPVAQGTYTKVGRIMVFYAIRVTYPATASGAQAKLGGLPFVVGSSVDAWGGGVSFSDAAAAMTFYAVSGASNLNVFLVGGANQTNANLSGKDVRLSGMYAAAP